MTPPSPAPSPRRIRQLRWLIGLALALGAWAFVVRGADQPENPYLLPVGGTTTTAPGATGAATARTPLAGFGETSITVTLPSGEVLRWCVLLAATEAQREQGLMNVTDPTLGGYDGMVFRFDGDTRALFYMKDTVQPLSIAFLAADGTVVGVADMAPCGDQDPCPTYGPGVAYRTAIEVPLGQLARLGIGTGAVVVDERTACAAA